MKTLTFYYKSINSAFHTLFPCNWCSSNNLKICPSNSWPCDKRFDWSEFENKTLETPASATLPPGWCLYFTKSSDVHNLFNWSRTIGQLAAEKFTVGAYLECVDPDSCGELICLAQIKARVDHLVFLELLYRADSTVPKQLHVFSVDSCEIFPLGWAEMNNFYGDRHDLYRKYLRFDDDSFLKLDEYISRTKPNGITPLSGISKRLHKLNIKFNFFISLIF